MSISAAQPRQHSPRLTLRLSGSEWATYVGLMAGVFLGALDSTVQATVLPQMLSELGSISFAPWILASYLVMQICTGPIFGRLSDQFGRKWVFVGAMAIFLFGSEFVARSSSAIALLAGRGVQGVGAGAIAPVALSSIQLLFPAHQRIRLQASFSTIYGVASIAGPILGILLANAFGWRAVFHLNAPIVVLACALVIRFMDDVPTESSGKLDALGAASFACGTLSGCAVLTALSDSDASLNPKLLGALVLFACAAAGAFIWAERRASSPIIPPRFVLTNAAASVGSVIAGTLMFSGFLFVPLLASAVFEASPLVGVMPLSLALVAGTYSCGRFTRRLGLRRSTRLGSAFVVAGCAWALMTSHVHALWLLVSGVVIFGYGIGVLLVVMIIALQFRTPAREMGMASSFAQFIRNFGGLLGMQAMAALQGVLFGSAQRGWSPAVQHLVAHVGGIERVGGILFGPVDSSLDPALVSIIRASYGQATLGVFVACGLLGCLGMWLARRVPSW